MSCAKRNGVVVCAKLLREFGEHSEHSLRYVEKMAESRRQTRSTRRREQWTDAQFWSNQPDRLMIERGQADAIRLVRSSVNPAPGTTTASGPTEANTTNTSGIPQIVFVDDEGLEEQFLTRRRDCKRSGYLGKPYNNTSEYNLRQTKVSSRRNMKNLIYNLLEDPERKA